MKTTKTMNNICISHKLFATFIFLTDVTYTEFFSLVSSDRVVEFPVVRTQLCQ